ncbi:hypothetical protein LTR53_002426 [Teratosphaeriaceae sp. CCFEE 6253]|nr:hypothetical protein LTR53_002426 [Teratosphaeriaceae sp. CCFEE 6253]
MIGTSAPTLLPERAARGRTHTASAILLKGIGKLGSYILGAGGGGAQSEEQEPASSERNTSSVGITVVGGRWCRGWADIEQTLEDEAPALPPRARATYHELRQDDDDYDEVQDIRAGEATVSVGRKREREAPVDEGSVKRRKARQAAIERGEGSAHGTQASSKAISVPTFYGGHLPKAVTRSGAMGGPFQPRNTLDQNPLSSSARRTGNMLRAVDSVLAPRRSQLALDTTKGGNVKAARPFTENHGDGFQLETGLEPPAKKAKTVHHGGTTGITSDVVDLTDHEQEGMLTAPATIPARSPTVEVVIARSPSAAVNGRAMSTISPAPRFTNLIRPANGASSLHPPKQRKEKHKAVFSTSFDAVDKAFALGKTGKKKPRNNRMPGGRADSGAGTPSTQSSGAPFRETGSRHAPVTVEDEGSQPMLQKAKGGQKRQISQDEPTLSIKLDVGVFDKQATDETRAAKKTVQVDFLKALRAGAAGQYTEREKLRLSATIVAPEERAASDVRLSQKFKRDDQGADTKTSAKKTKARERMQGSTRDVPSSGASPIDDSLSSIDPLDGDTTVGSRASRSASPKKKQAGAARRMSPSIFMPTNFKGSKGANKGKREATDSVQDDVIESCPVRAIYSLARCLTRGEASLVFHRRPNTLQLYEHDKPAKLSSGQQIGFGVSEAQKMFYSPDIPRVYIRGSMNAVSSGGICIAFDSYKDVVWLMNRLQLVTHDQIDITFQGPERLSKVFQKQTGEIEIAHAAAVAAASKATNELNDRLKSLEEDQRRKAAGNAGSELSDGTGQTEHIQYEESPPPPPPTRAQAMINAAMGRRSTNQPATAAAPRPRQIPELETATPRRSLRERRPVLERVPTPPVEKWTRVHKLKPWSKGVEYPPNGARRVTVDFVDLERLDEDEWLNDNIVSMKLRQIEEDIADEWRDKVHFFNTFFYTSLSLKNGKKAFNYDGVKKWTKGKDLLSLPYVVVPINADMHWYVAIIANLDKLKRGTGLELDEVPGGEGEGEFDYLNDDERDKAADLAGQRGLESSATVGGPDAAGQQSRDTESAMKQLSIESSKEVSPGKDTRDSSPGSIIPFGENGLVLGNGAESRPPSEPPSSAPTLTAGITKKGGKRCGPPPRRYDPDTPAVIVLDSFGRPHPEQVRMLKDYITAEADDKRAMGVAPTELQGITAKGIPAQTNFYDCGIYLISYIEQFSKDPRKFVEKVLSRQMDEDSDFATFDPAAKRAEIREWLLKLNEEQEAARRGAKREKARGGATPAAVRTSAVRSVPGEKDVVGQGQRDVSGPPAPPPSTASQSIHAPLERAKAQSPERSAPISAVGPGMKSVDEDDTLESEPARALEERGASARPAGVPPSREDFRGSETSEDGEDDGNDMLDGTTDVSAGHVSSGMKVLATGKDHLLDHLASALTQRATRSGKHAQSSLPRPEDEQSGSGDDSEEGIEVHSSRQQQRVVQEHGEAILRLPEIDDSQESLRILPDSQQWKGTRTRFED